MSASHQTLVPQAAAPATLPPAAPAAAPSPFSELAAQLRPELNPVTQLEEMFFTQIVSLSVLASFLMRHIESDPDLLNPATPRRLRMFLANQGRLRYAYEEFRRFQLARHIQESDPSQAGVPILLVVATHTNRNGLRAQRKPQSQPRLDAPVPLAAPAPRPDALAESGLPIGAPPTPITRPATPGRNSACPCNSGRKYKHCCANKPMAA